MAIPNDLNLWSRLCPAPLLKLAVWGLVLGGFLQPAPSRAAQPESAPISTTAKTAGAEAPGAKKSAKVAAVAVSVAPLTKRKVQRTVGAVGSFYGYDEVTVTAEVSGRVVKVFHDVGDVVKPGDVLLQLDTSDFELALEDTRRQLELDATRIGLGEYVPPDEEFVPEKVLALIRTVFNLEKLPSVIRARETMKNSQERLKRAEQLTADPARRVISEEELKQRATDFDVASANYSQAKYDAWAVVAGIKYRLVQMRIAQRKLSLATIRVPTPTQRERMPKEIQYSIVQRKVTEGEMVKDAPGTSSATFELVMDGVLKLKSSVPERFVSQVKEGQAAEIRVEAYPGKVFSGEVVRINPLIDRTSRTFQVEVYLENPRREVAPGRTVNELKAGGFAKVDILTHVDPDAWTAPAEAIVSYAGSTKIFVEREGVAHAVPVATGIEGRGWVELIRPEKSDLRLTDSVIISGQEKLAEGVPVYDRGEKKKEPTP